LIAASSSGYYDIVRLLTAHGALRDENDSNAATHNGDCPSSSRKLISASELSRHLTTSHRPYIDAATNGDCPRLSHKLISAPELSKHLTIS
jgi:hypothetical protein